MSKEIELEFAKKLQEYYKCKVIINEQEPYTLICAADLGKILGIKNITQQFRNKDIKKVFFDTITKGGNQKMLYTTYKTILQIIVKSRKPNVIEFANKMNLDLETKIYSCIESDTLKCILDSFQNEEMILQYKINNYLLDLYFPKYKLIIECDESNHQITQNKLNDIKRENEIKILIEDCTFIRYNPEEKDFNIFKIINKIFNHIVNCRCSNILLKEIAI